jgi:4-diphosphocytidyl-2-C-methyl-D-erythritol kinase
MTLELIAPAKLNLALEVTGRRPDGYHDLVTVMQTIDLADTVRLDENASIELSLSGEQMRGVPREGPRNLAYAAAQALMQAAGRPDLGVRIELEKSIPAGMGLGGGSSDAAAVLRGLNRLWELHLPEDDLTRVAADVGSDVPFFLAGGAALVTGRGEHVEPLPDSAPLALTLFVSRVELEDKTRRMYSMITPADYSDGHKARVLAESLRRALPLSTNDLVNPFSRHVGEAAPTMAGAMALCNDAGIAVLAAGSGPGFFTLLPRHEIPSLLVRELSQDWGVHTLACKALGRTDATSVIEV